MNITLSDLFQFCLVVIGIISLCIQAKKEETAVPYHRLAIPSMIK